MRSLISASAKLHGNAAFVVENAANEFARLRPGFFENDAIPTPAKVITEARACAAANIKSLGEFLAEKLGEAITSGKGDYFRSLADAAEKFRSPANPLEEKIVSYLGMFESLGFTIPPRTVTEWIAMANKAWPDLVQDKEDDQLRRIFKQCGLPIKADKRGRKTGS